jgi:PAS domain S-box-containing protein
MVTVKSDARATAPRTELAALLACTHDAVVGATPDGVITSWNPAAAVLYGYPSEEVVGRHAQDLVAEDRRAHDAEILDRVTRGEPAEQYDTTWLCKDASAVTVSLNASALVDPAGTVVGVMLVSSRLQALPEAAQRTQQAIAVPRLTPTRNSSMPRCSRPNVWRCSDASPVGSPTTSTTSSR